ncbi:tripartite tricarboxylate transporter TctB family protein [Salipiger thiooxidans]|uniref:tripartite tricarboxylate transporter TctB family protein n=1 Tax=Salipiger thiooxidans TaxID=282683 RepID=UPI001CD6233D|nr:tripartite tricarboxylate transporter TctB family protein [Salipiger thiooxidans]MCA0847968.1 tripartite tricarboxylate transporter TctB family protein [Salipiger thiooxidans]
MTRRTFAPDAGGLISGAIMLAIGTAIKVITLIHGIGSLLRVEAGFFPLLLGAGAILLGLAITLRHRLFPAHSDEADTPLPESIDWTERWHRLRPMLVVPLGIAAFSALLETAGLLIATFALVLISGLSAEKPDLGQLAMIALLAPVGAWVIFVLGFGLPFKLY